MDSAGHHFMRGTEQAKLAFGHGTPGVHCYILRISESEAMVRLNYDPGAPPRTVILIRPSTETAYAATVVWSDTDLLRLRLDASTKTEADR
jgi:hypothetical protein